MRSIKVEIQGTAPLLLNKFTDEAQMEASSGTRLTNKGDRGTPRDQAEKKLYTNEQGYPGVPQPNVFRCLIDAGTFFKSGKSKITTQKSSMLPACLEIEELFIEIDSDDGWDVDTRPVRIPSTGGRILCHRPSFNDWKIGFTLSYDPDMISGKLVREIVDAAGKRIGLGDFRPACKGPFGKFVVSHWEEVPAEHHRQMAAE